MRKPMRIEDKLDQLAAYFGSEASILAVLIFGSYQTKYYINLAT
jgi:hypothetical protein